MNGRRYPWPVASGIFALAAALVALLADVWLPQRTDCKLGRYLSQWVVAEPVPGLSGIKMFRLRVHGPGVSPNVISPDLFAEIERDAVGMVQARIAEMNATSLVQVQSADSAQSEIRTPAGCEILDVDVLFFGFARGGGTGDRITGSYLVTVTRSMLARIRNGTAICAEPDVQPFMMRDGPYPISSDPQGSNDISAAARRAIRAIVDYGLTDFIYFSSTRTLTEGSRLIRKCVHYGGW